MSAQEMQRWQVFTLRHPLPADLLDIHCAMLASIIANIARGEDSSPFTPDQFFVLRGAPTPEERIDAATRRQPPMSEAERMLQGAGMR